MLTVVPNKAEKGLHPTPTSMVSGQEKKKQLILIRNNIKKSQNLQINL